MKRFATIISFLSVIIIVFMDYQSLIVAQSNVSDECISSLNIFTFEYNNTSWQEYTEIIENASCDIDFFWSQVDGLQVNYQSPNYVVQEYSSSPFITPTTFTSRTQNGACNIRPTFVAGYYCTSPYSIVFSEPTDFLDYLRWERNQHGKLNVALFLAHEWGHHIQLSSLNDHAVPELQAECFVGAYFQYAISNPDQTLVDFSQGDWDALMQVIPISSNEPAGDIERWEDITIGERGRALRMGYQGGVSLCLSELPLTQPE
jgi:predicted metalloprotease